MELMAGININNGLISAERPIIEDLLDRTINFDLIFNTDYEVKDGTTLKFIAPFNLPSNNMAKSSVADPCKMTYTCVGGEDWELPMTEWLSEGYAFDTCATTMLSSNAITSAFANYIKNWNNARLYYALNVLKSNFTDYMPAEPTENIKELVETMVVALEDQGFDRADVVVLLSHNASSQWRRLGLKSCQCSAKNPSTDNDLGVASIVEMGNRLYKTGTPADVLVYVKGYALAGRYCVVPPYISNGAEGTGYEQSTLIKGRMGHGAGYFNIDAGLKYTL